LSLVHSSHLELEARVDGATVYFEDLLALQQGDILQFDVSVDQPVIMRVNGLTKYNGNIAVSNRKRTFVVSAAQKELA
jgi:flagellar motor switch protein FliM